MINYIRIYSNRILQESKNRVIEDFDTFLEKYGYLAVEEKIQPENLELNKSIVITFAREQAFTDLFVSYVVILDEEKKNPQYYFVENYEFISNYGIRLSLKLDTLHQFGKDSTTFANLALPGALIHRQHGFRFKNLKHVATILESGEKQTTLWRDLDLNREGISAEKLIYSDSEISQKVLPNEQWNVVFSIGSFEESGAQKHSTFRAWLLSSREVASADIKTYHKNSNGVTNSVIRSIADLPSDFSYINKIINIPYCPCNIYDKGDGSFAFDNPDGSTNEGSNFGFVYASTLCDEKGITSTYPFKTLCTAGNVANFEDGKPLGVTAFRLPQFKATNLFDEIDFDSELKLTLDGEISENDLVSKYKIIDSKLYTSEFYSIVFSFEGTSKVLSLEDFSMSIKNDSILGRYIATPKYHLNYYVSNAMNPTIMFEFTFAQGGYRVKRDPTQDFLIVNGSFEQAIYTDSYLEYLRNGYNYDLKSKEQQTRMAVINSAVNIGSGAIMAGVGLASGNPIGSVISASKVIGSAESLYNTIENQASQQRKWEQEQRLKAETSANVSGPGDTNLRQIYYPKLKLTKYWISSRLRNSLNTLFYLYGYKSELLSTISPTLLNSRHWFNFISADIDLSPDTTPTQMTREMEEDFKAKVSQGVTFFHHNDGNTATKYSGWDILQLMENWENILL